MTGGGAGLPRRIALLAVDATDAVSCLFADFAEALPVYAELAGMAAPELVLVDDARAADGCDTVLLGALFDAGEKSERLAACLRSCAPGTRVYALGATDTRDPRSAVPTLAALVDACEELGLLWMGSVMMGHAALLPNVAGCPRMGWARRRTSEAVDRLIAAVRAGLPAGDELVRPSVWARVVSLASSGRAAR